MRNQVRSLLGLGCTLSIINTTIIYPETILRFLYDHIDKSADNQARVRWEPNTIVLWDNRVTAHSANVDFRHLPDARHGARITPQGERPIPALEGLDLSA